MTAMVCGSTPSMVDLVGQVLSAPPTAEQLYSAHSRLVRTRYVSGPTRTTMAILMWCL